MCNTDSAIVMHALPYGMSKLMFADIKARHYAYAWPLAIGNGGAHGAMHLMISRAYGGAPMHGIKQLCLAIQAIVCQEISLTNAAGTLALSLHSC